MKKAMTRLGVFFAFVMFAMLSPFVCLLAGISALFGEFDD